MHVEKVLLVLSYSKRNYFDKFVSSLENVKFSKIYLGWYIIKKSLIELTIWIIRAFQVLDPHQQPLAKSSIKEVF